MFGLFKKKPVVKKERVYETVRKDIGRTLIRLTFKDNETFNTIVYGYYFRSEWSGDNFKSSLDVAKEILVQSDHSVFQNPHAVVYVDDQKNVMVTKIGEVVKKEIIATEEYFEDFKVEVFS